MGTPTRQPVTLGKRPCVDLLSPDELEQLHQASLQVLAETGVTVRSRAVLDALAEHGANVEVEQSRVRLPSEMVEAALRAAPKSYLLAGRDPAVDMMLDRSAGYLCVEGGLTDVVDIESGALRKPVYQDLVDATRLADGLDEITYLWPCTAISDVPPEDQAVHQTYAQLAHSVKHVVAMTTYNPTDARAVIEMAQIVTGGADELRRRPAVSSFACSISPLTWDGEPIEAALAFAEAGVPCGITAMPVSTAGAPTTLAGHLVIANADVLSGITILQTLFPGAPTYYNPFSANMDLASGNMDSAWALQPMLFNLAAAQLGRRYGIPVSLGVNGTGSKTQDWQAGAQGGLLMMGILGCGDIDLLGCAGSLDNSRVFSFEQVVLDCELFRVAAELTKGFVVDAEHLAVSVIDEVGPGNHFLASKHTRRHMRDLWRSSVMSAATWDEWEVSGRKGAEDTAREKAREIVATHEPPPLPEDVDQELQRVVRAYTDGRISR
jgi:trimethylamine---corrinoid protein Co-methyltransferase